MIQTLLNAFKAGFWHLLNLQVLLQLLFLFVLLLAIDLKNWQKLISFLSSFIIGIFITILLSHYKVIHTQRSVELLLISITILSLCIINIVHKKTYNNAFYTLLIGLFGCFHGLRLYHHFHVVFPHKNIVISALSYSVGLEVAAVIFILLASLLIGIISWLSKVSKNQVENVLNAICLLIAIYYIYIYFF